ncbi:hypothetical protein LY76DRAFT_592401, partial [Colletotrichum caudatum]
MESECDSSHTIGIAATLDCGTLCCRGARRSLIQMDATIGDLLLVTSGQPCPVLLGDSPAGLRYNALDVFLFLFYSEITIVSRCSAAFREMPCLSRPVHVGIGWFPLGHKSLRSRIICLHQTWRPICTSPQHYPRQNGKWMVEATVLVTGWNPSALNPNRGAGIKGVDDAGYRAYFNDLQRMPLLHRAAAYYPD